MYLYFGYFSDASICKQWVLNNNSTVTPEKPWNSSDPLAPNRLESIKNSISEISLLSKTNASDFIFDFDKAVTGVSKETGGRTVAAASANFPGLINHGISMTIGFLGPCGINLPHTHPRATEINFSVDGDFQIGAIHFEQNLNCVPATVVGATLSGLNISTIEDIQLQLAQNPSIGIAECRQRCGL